MKRKILLIILCVLLVAGIFYLQISREPTVNNFITTSAAEGYQAALTITMNKIMILDREKTEQDLVNRILENNFANMQFSYDVMGYPKEFSVTVYANDVAKHIGRPAFEFEYVFE